MHIHTKLNVMTGIRLGSATDYDEGARHMNMDTGLTGQIECYLNAATQQLKMTASNMANATTPGYTEEAAIWQQAAPIRVGQQSVGNGVVDVGAVSQRDLVLNRSIDVQTQVEAASGSRLAALQDLQATFASATSVSTASGVSATDGGISSSLSSFFGSLEQLEASPADVSIRQSVLASANTLASSFNAAASSLQQQQQSLNGEVSSVVTQANGLLTSLAGLNGEIQSQDPNKDAGALEDQRQQDLASLTQLIGLQQTTTERNGISLSTVDGAPLLEGSSASPLTITEIDGATHIYQGSTDITEGILSGGGIAGGMLQVANQDIPTAMTAVDTLAFQVGSQINALNTAGSDLNGNAGTPFFALHSTEQGSAGDIAVVLTDPATIAAASSGEGTADGTNASAMAAIANTSLGGLNNLTPADFYSSFVAALGSTVSSVTSTNNAQQASLSQLKNQQTALSGVSLDSEATSPRNDGAGLSGCFQGLHHHRHPGYFVHQSRSGNSRNLEVPMQINASYLAGLTDSLNQLTTREQTLTNELSSGLAVNSLSDNPVAAGENVTLSALLQQDVSYQQASTGVSSVLQVKDSAVGSVISQLTQAITVATQGSNGTQNAAETETTTTELSGIRAEILSLANTTFQGSYLFAGSKGSTEPFTLSASSIGAQPASVSYQGDSHVSYLQAPDGSNIPITTDGSALFLNNAPGATNILGTLSQLISAFQNGDGATVTSLTGTLNGSVTFLSTQRANIDDALSNIKTEQNSVTSQSTQLTVEQTALMGSDTAQVATSLSTTENQQTGLEDAIAALEKQGSLFNLLAS